MLPETSHMGKTIRLPPNHITSSISESTWSCRFCNNPYDFARVTSEIDKMEQELHSIIDYGDSHPSNTPQLLLKFVSKHSSELHSKHYLNLLGRYGCWYCQDKSTSTFENPSPVRIQFSYALGTQPPKLSRARN